MDELFEIYGDCPEGASTEEHVSALAEIGSCPFCGLSDSFYAEQAAIAASA